MTAKIDGTNGLLQQYDYQVLITGFSYTFAAGITVLLINPAGSLASGTIIMPAAPVDGMTISFSSTQTISTLTVSSNTGQSIVGAPTTLLAGTTAGFVYRSTNSTWYTQSKGFSSAPAQIQPISASVATNALTISASPLSLDFRSTTLGSGAVTTVTGTPTNLVVPTSATLGAVNAVQSRLVVIALNNAGTIELAVVNISGGTNLDETTLLTTTAITSGATSASTVYSTSARTSVAFRVIGFIDSTQASAGTWATAPSTIQGVGGQALTALSSIGYGQTWQTVSRSFGVTYYNTTGKPISAAVTIQAASAGANTWSITVNGVTLPQGGGNSSANFYQLVPFIVPIGATYSFNNSSNSLITGCAELR